MKKLIIIILLAMTGLSAGSSNHASRPEPTADQQLKQTVDNTTAKVGKLLATLKQKR